MACAALLFAANLALQLGMSARGLDDAPVNALHPTSTDALEYVRAAKAVAEGRAGGPEGGFTEGFGSAWRTPGYSLFLAGFERVFDAPLQAARIAQILLTASIGPIVLWALSSLLPFPAALAGAALAAAWPPLYHYSAAILAEPLSLWLTTLLLAVLARFARRARVAASMSAGIAEAVVAGALLAALIYLKPNHALMALPVCGFLFVASKLRGGRDARAARLSLYAPLAAMGMTALLLAPWSLFASRQQGSFVALSTTSGYNLYLGTGVPPVDAEDGSLPARAARALGLRGGPEALPQEPAHAPGAWSSAAWSAEQGLKARALWAARPVAETLYGAAKVLHAFGFSLRGARDALLALFFVAAAAAAATLRRLGGRDDAELRAWVVFFWLCALTVALQAFVWLPNQRLKTVLFDLPALWTLSLCLGMWLRRRRNDAMAK